MQRLDQRQRREALELAQMEEEIGRLAGHQSEPTTPPEYRDNSGFPSMFSRPNRYSMSSLASPPGLFNRPARSGSQLTSPPSGLIQNRYGYEEPMPSRSVPTTRRNSDDEEKEEAVRQDPTSHRSTNVYVPTRACSFLESVNIFFCVQCLSHGLHSSLMELRLRELPGGSAKQSSSRVA